jgi:RND superfamily putative drug exporter
MWLEAGCDLVCRRPGWIIAGWLALSALVGGLSPNLTRLAAEGHAYALSADAESERAARIIRESWPDQSYHCTAVAALYRRGGLTDADRTFAGRLATRFEAQDRPREIVRVMGPHSDPQIAERLVSTDNTLSLIAIPLSTPFYAPATHEAVKWLGKQSAGADLATPAGLEVRWTGDAVIGREYMAKVQTSLDRAALATVVLLLIVLLFVYRSIWLALIPLATIGASVVIARGLLAWAILAGWEVSPLVELFLIAILFGTGTDFCLFVSWRYAEHLGAADPVGSMRQTLSRAASALFTSAGTIMVGLLLMGTTRFKLFSTTGPSVALGLAVALLATVTLTPALLVVLARAYPRAYAGLAAGSGHFWERLGRGVMARPLQCWLGTVLVMIPLALLGLSTHFVQDLLTELSASAASAQDFRLVASKFEPGVMAPLTVVLESDTDLRTSQGLALIDDVSRFLSHQRKLTEVRSATQPFGSPHLLERARISSRLGEINSGLGRLADGACQLKAELMKGAAKLKATLLVEHFTGLSLIGRSNASIASSSAAATRASRPSISSSRHPVADDPPPEKPQQALLRKLTEAEEAAGLIAGGASRAGKELKTILTDPVGRRAFDRLLINNETVQDHPELSRSFAAYITPDGRRARLDLTQAGRMFSHDAMDQTELLRRQLNEYLGEYDAMHITAVIGGANAESADVRALTHADQVQSWIIVPIGVFLVLILTLRDPLACFNLVATMVLTYAFALGVAHLVFVTLLGAPGLDWKVPYFLFVLLVAVGVDYNVFLMTRLQEESSRRGLHDGIIHAIGQTGGLISSAALITACSFASFLFSPLASLRQLGLALVVGILVDAILVRPLLVPCGHWLLRRLRELLSARAAIPQPVIGYDGVAAGFESAAAAFAAPHSNGNGKTDWQSVPQRKPAVPGAAIDHLGLHRTDSQSASRSRATIPGSGVDRNGACRTDLQSVPQTPKLNGRENSARPAQILARSRIDAHDLALIQMLGHLDGAAG